MRLHTQIHFDHLMVELDAELPDSKKA